MYHVTASCKRPIGEKHPNGTNYSIVLWFKGFPGYHTGFMSPPDQRRTPGAGQYYAEYATITNQGGRSGPNRPPDIPQVTAAMQDYTDYSLTGK